MTNAFVSAFVAACLGFAAFHKWRDLEAFRAAIAEFSLLRGLPSTVQSRLVRIVPLAEAAAAALLLVPVTTGLGAVLATALALAFVVVVAIDSRPAIAHCGCWGTASVDVPKSFHLARAGILLVAAVAAAATGFGSSVSTAWD
jgi:hypothetical protein